MSLAARNKKCSYCDKNSTSIVFDIRYLNSNHCRGLVTSKSDPPAIAFELKFVRFLISRM